MSVEQLAAIAGIILSLALAYLPKVKDWYNALASEQKAQVMGALLVLSAVGVFGLSCAHLFDLVACTVAGAKDMIGILIAALIANQATFLIAVRPFRAN